MKVVSDTSPICYLLLIGEIDILPALYERIHIPEAVDFLAGRLLASPTDQLPHNFQDLE